MPQPASASNSTPLPARRSLTPASNSPATASAGRVSWPKASFSSSGPVNLSLATVHSRIPAQAPSRPPSPCRPASIPPRSARANRSRLPCACGSPSNRRSAWTSDFRLNGSWAASNACVIIQSLLDRHFRDVKMKRNPAFCVASALNPDRAVGGHCLQGPRLPFPGAASTAGPSAAQPAHPPAGRLIQRAVSRLAAPARLVPGTE